MGSPDGVFQSIGDQAQADFESPATRERRGRVTFVNYLTMLEFLETVLSALEAKNLESAYPNTVTVLRDAIAIEQLNTAKRSGLSNENGQDTERVSTEAIQGDFTLRQPYQAGRRVRHYEPVVVDEDMTEMLALIKQAYPDAPVTGQGMTIAFGYDTERGSLKHYLSQRIKELRQVGLADYFFAILAVQMAAVCLYIKKTVEPFEKLLTSSLSLSFNAPTSENRTASTQRDEEFQSKINDALFALGYLHATNTFMYAHMEVFGSSPEVPQPFYLWLAVLYMKNPDRYELNDLPKLGRRRIAIYKLLHTQDFSGALKRIRALEKEYPGTLNPYYLQMALQKPQGETSAGIA